MTWQQYEWEDIEDYDDFKNGVMGWLGPWNKIMENEVAQHSVINWKRKYAFRYKRDKLRKNLGNWAGNYLIGPDLYNNVWDERSLGTINHQRQHLLGRRDLGI